MEELGANWQEACAKWSEVADSLTEEELAMASNCPGWSVGDIHEHATEGALKTAQALGMDVDENTDWDTLRVKVYEALQNPENLDETLEQFGGLTRGAVSGLLVSDLLIHSWDLAKTLGKDQELPKKATSAALFGLKGMDDSLLRGKGMFGPSIDVLDDASEQQQLLAFTGRIA